MAVEGRMAIEVVYALPDRQVVVTLRAQAGTTAGDAIRLSQLAERFKEIDLATAPIGIHGRVVERATVLSDGDRVEIYRPLVADPKQVRRRRAARER